MKISADWLNVDPESGLLHAWLFFTRKVRRYLGPNSTRKNNKSVERGGYDKRVEQGFPTHRTR